MMPEAKVIKMPYDPEKASAMLRILADQIDRGGAPDYAVVIDDGSGWNRSGRSMKDKFSLAGALLNQSNLILAGEYSEE